MQCMSKARESYIALRGYAAGSDLHDAVRFFLHTFKREDASMSKIFVAVDPGYGMYVVVSKVMPVEVGRKHWHGDDRIWKVRGKRSDVLLEPQWGGSEINIKNAVLGMLGIDKEQFPKKGECLEWDVVKGEGILWQGIWKE